MRLKNIQKDQLPIRLRSAPTKNMTFSPPLTALAPSEKRCVAAELSNCFGIVWFRKQNEGVLSE